MGAHNSRLLALMPRVFARLNTRALVGTYLVVLGTDLATSKLTRTFSPFGPSCGRRRSRHQRSYLGYYSAASTLSPGLTSDAACDGDNTPELSKSFTSLMKESRFSIAPAFFPAFIMLIAC